MKENLINFNQAQVKRKEKKEEKKKSENAIFRAEYEINNTLETMKENFGNEEMTSFREQVIKEPIELFDPEADLPIKLKQAMAKLNNDIVKAIGEELSEEERNVILRLAFNNIIHSGYARQHNPEYIGGLAEEIAAEEEERERFKKAA